MRFSSLAQSPAPRGPARSPAAARGAAPQKRESVATGRRQRRESDGSRLSTLLSQTTVYTDTSRRLATRRPRLTSPPHTTYIAILYRYFTGQVYIYCRYFAATIPLFYRCPRLFSRSRVSNESLPDGQRIGLHMLQWRSSWRRFNSVAHTVSEGFSTQKAATTLCEAPPSR